MGNCLRKNPQDPNRQLDIARPPAGLSPLHISVAKHEHVHVHEFLSAEIY